MQQPQHLNNPLAPTFNQHMGVQPSGRSPMTPQGGLMGHPNMYNPPRPPEVYTLPDQINEALPAQVRENVQRDASGRVLFFTAPPLDRMNSGISSESAALGHSARYLAGRKEWLAERNRKRKERDEGSTTEGPKRVSLEEDSLSEETNKNAVAMTGQAASAMISWLQHFDKDTQQWTKDAGLEGWRESVNGNA
jgi:chromatin structure-remodeling complex subunit RSC1/2